MPETQPVSVPELVKRQVREHPALAVARIVSNNKSWLDRNTIHGDPYLPHVSIYAGFKQAEFDPDRITTALNDIVAGIRPHELKGTAAAAHLDYVGEGSNRLHPAKLYLY